MNYSTASHAQLENAGFTVTVMKSQMKRRRRSKWVKPAINSAAGFEVKPIGRANETYRGCI